MVKPLSGAARRALMLWSIALCAGSSLLAPLAAQSSGDFASVGTDAAPLLRVPDLPREGVPAAILLTHDPFRPDAPPSGQTQTSGMDAAGPGSAIVGTTVVAGTPLGSLSPAPESVVSAIVMGNEAQALVVQNGRSEIVRVGALLDGQRIVAITAQGVRLENGTVRRVYEDHP